MLRRRMASGEFGEKVQATEVARVLGVTEEEMSAILGSVRADQRRMEWDRKRRKTRDIVLASAAGVLLLFGVFIAGGLLMPMGAFQRNLDPTVQQEMSARVVFESPVALTKGLTFTSKGSEVAQTEAIFDLKDAPGFKLLIDQSLRNLDQAFPNRFEQSSSVYSSQDELKFLERNAARGQFAFVRINLTAVGSDGRSATSNLVWPVYTGSRPEVLSEVEKARSARLKEALEEIARKALLVEGESQPHPSVARLGG